MSSNNRGAAVERARASGRALASLANECELYAKAFYRRAGLWRALHYTMVTIGSIGPPLIGAVFILVPGVTNGLGIASIVTGAVTAVCSFSGVRDLAVAQEAAGDGFKKIGMDIQYDGLESVGQNATSDIKPYLDRVKALIDTTEDPGVSVKHLEWVHDHADVSIDLEAGDGGDNENQRILSVNDL